MFLVFFQTNKLYPCSSRKAATATFVNFPEL